VNPATGKENKKRVYTVSAEVVTATSNIYIYIYKEEEKAHKEHVC